MDPINSQTLTHSDGYYHQFTNIGDYTWGIMVRQSYMIHVKQPPVGHTPAQTIIELTFDSGSFQVPPGQKDFIIYVGDSVLWHNDSSDAGVPIFSIVADNGLLTTDAAYDYFSNRSLGKADAFSHLFLSPGNYQYSVNGGSSGPQSGTIPVVLAPNPPPAAAVVMVTLNAGNNPVNPTPEPVTKAGNVPIYPGDTVLWQIKDGSKLVIKTS